MLWCFLFPIASTHHLSLIIQLIIHINYFYGVCILSSWNSNDYQITITVFKNPNSKLPIGKSTSNNLSFLLLSMILIVPGLRNFTPEFYFFLIRHLLLLFFLSIISPKCRDCFHFIDMYMNFLAHIIYLDFDLISATYQPMNNS